MADTDKQHFLLREISPDLIDKNPDNPRIIFRGEELDVLMSSIRRFGIQVPITVYAKEGRFVLIDGERRWRCSLKLNLKKIPAIVQPEPSPLQNLLLMFNIHSLREQWDYFTIANKLPSVIERFTDEQGHEPNEIELSEATGLTRGQVRRCRLLLELPEQYRNLLMEELERPKQMQQLSEDMFIEMERALKTVLNRVPDLIDDLDVVRHNLINKYRDRIINNVVDFRKLAKIATSINGLGIEEKKAKTALSSIFYEDQVGISDVFEEQFAMHYGEHRVLQQVEALAEYLEELVAEGEAEWGDDLRFKLNKLRHTIDMVLG